MHQQKRSLWSDFKRFFEPLSENSSVFIKTCIAYFIRGLDGVFGIIFIKQIVHAVEIGDTSMFYKWTTAFGITIILYFIIRYGVRNWSWVITPRKTQQYIHKKYISRFLQLDGNSIEKYGTGKLVAIIDKGMFQRSNLIDESVKNIWAIVLTLVASFYLVAQLGWLYVIAFLGMVIIAHVIVIKLNALTALERRNQVDAVNKYSSHLTKIIMSKAEVFQNRKWEQEIQKLSSYMDDAIDSNLKRSNNAFMMFELPTLIVNLFRLLVIFIIGYNIVLSDPGFSFAQLTAIIAAFAALHSMLDVSIYFFKEFTKKFNVIERLREFMDETPSILGYEEGKNFEYNKGDIDLDNISFDYDGMRAISNLSLNLQGGKRTAFVGASGAGKSTLIKLIAGYIYPTKGNILVDNQLLPTKKNIKKSVNLRSYYDHIGYLTQEPNVFDGSIYDNLTYALNYTPGSEEINKAIELAQCQFIHEFKNGLQTEIGEKGIRLSGGQRQRLAIAKIFLKNPAIVLLDEPTSALDSLSEEAITKAMHNLFEGRTVIIIAHRLQTVKQADDIIVLEAGKVIERGTHQELVKMGGHYAKMLELQSGF